MYKVGIDLDSVLCNIEQGIEDYLRKVWNLDLVWDKHMMCFEFDRNPYLSNAIAKDLRQIVTSEEFLSKGFLYPGCDRYLNSLVENGFEIHIVTGRHENLAGDVTRKWLADNNIPYTGLHMTNGVRKEEVAYELKLDAFIEDNFDTITEVLRKCGPLKYGTYIVDHPWNRLYKSPLVIRVEWFGIAVECILRLKSFEGRI